MKRIAILIVLAMVISLNAQVVKLTPENVQSTMVREGVAVMILTSSECDACTAMLSVFEKLAKANPDVVFAEFNLETEGFEDAKQQVGQLEEPMISVVIGGEWGEELKGTQTLEEMQSQVDAWKAQWQEQLAARTGFKAKMDFTLADLNGNEVTLGELDGLIILDFWATWCPPCRAEIPVLQKLKDEYGERGLIIVGVSAEEKQTIADWVAEQREQGVAMDYYLLVDADHSVNDLYSIQSIPTTYFIAPNGDLIKKHGGFAPQMEPEFRAQIEANLPEGK